VDGQVLARQRLNGTSTEIVLVSSRCDPLLSRINCCDSGNIAYAAGFEGQIGKPGLIHSRPIGRRVSSRPPEI
jgi:hypothetical protein